MATTTVDLLWSEISFQTGVGLVIQPQGVGLIVGDDLCNSFNCWVDLLVKLVGRESAKANFTKCPD